VVGQGFGAHRGCEVLRVELAGGAQRAGAGDDAVVARLQPRDASRPQRRVGSKQVTDRAFAGVEPRRLDAQRLLGLALALRGDRQPGVAFAQRPVRLADLGREPVP